MFLIQSAVDNDILNPSCTLAISTSDCIFKIVTIKIFGSNGKSYVGNTSFISNFIRNAYFCQVYKVLTMHYKN